MKKILAILLCVALFAAIFAGCGADKVDVFKIGVMCPASGDMAAVGDGTKLLIEYMEKEFNDAGGINGMSIEFVFEDDLGTAAGATTAIKKLIDVDKVNAIIGPYFTSCVLAVTPTLLENQVVAISPTASPAEAFSEDGYFFSLDQQNIKGTEFQCSYYEKLGITKLAILGTYNDHTLEKIEQFEELFPEHGGTVVASETFQSGADNYRTELTKIKNANPEALYVNVSDQEFVKVVREMEELGFDPSLPIFCIHELAVDFVYNEVGELLDGRFYCETPVAPAGSAEDEQVIRFNESYADWYTEQSGNSATNDQSIAFDCARMIVEAAKNAKSLSGADLRAALKDLKNIEGVTGFFTFNADGTVDRTCYMMKYENGKMDYLVD